MVYLWPCRIQGLGVIQCTILKMSCISKMAGRRAERTEIWDSGTLIASMTYMVYLLLPCGVQGHVGVIRCTCLKMACNSKTAVRRVKWSDLMIWHYSNTYMGHLSYIGSSCMAVRHLTCSYLSIWQVTKQISRSPWASCFSAPSTMENGISGGPKIEGNVALAWYFRKTL